MFDFLVQLTPSGVLIFAPPLGAAAIAVAMILSVVLGALALGALLAGLVAWIATQTVLDVDEVLKG